jgi:murein DD-endopeptidase MepM/ murein hydrolase activator NlpD
LKVKTFALSLLACLAFAVRVPGQPFQLPTANQALYEAGGGDRFFVGTVGKTWDTGTFGCVRTDGWQMHEGLDIRCLKRDKRNEPVDPVMASAEGAVAYISTKAGLSNYGKYVILRHRIEGIEVFTLYAHLSEVRSDLKPGQPVKAGETIATMGRTTNTRQPITKDRPHVHFEINVLVNERFPDWFKQKHPGERNDHGLWNGRNLLGIDPRLVFLAQRAQGTTFSLLHFIQAKTELCRVTVRDVKFPWLERYHPLLKRNPVADREGIAGHEIAFDYNGVPFQIIPRAASELAGKAKVRLLSVNEEEQKKHPCRKLVTRKAGNWQLTNAGQNLISLLTY